MGMIPCGCRKEGYCAREAGAFPANQMLTLCRKKVVVPRHEPIIDRNWLFANGTGGQWGMWKDKMEPIEDEQ